MEDKHSAPLVRCPTCRAVILGEELDRMTNKCPFCLPVPDSQTEIPAARPESPRRERRD